MSSGYGKTELERETLEELILEALDEAFILECGRGKFSEENMLYVAQRLSGAPFSYVEELYLKKKKLAKEIA